MRLNSLPRSIGVLTLSLAFCSVSTLSSAAQARSRIAQPVSAANSVAIHGSVHPRVRLGTDLGPVAANLKMAGMSIRFNMSDAQQAALDQLLSDLQDPASPRYHHWLTPTDYAAQFGLSSADLAKVSDWLTSRGFTVTGIANGGTFINFEGTAAQVQAAFSTSIHNLSLNGETHFANVSEVFVPGAIAGVVAGVTGLHNFQAQPRLSKSVIPAFTSSVTGNHFMAPGDAYTIYNVTPLLNNGITGAGVGTGANCHSVPSGTPCGDIAVTGQVDINLVDIAAFRNASGLSNANPPMTLHANGVDPGPPCASCNTGPSQGDLSESSIDVEWSGALAPGASILFVNAGFVLPNAMAFAIDDNVAPIVTTSYGLCEAGWGSTDMLTLNALFKQANAQGQTILAASADQGATDCDSGPSARQGLAVDFPGSSPYVISVGGTMFNDGNVTGATSYWSGSNGSTSGSAISYIPETAWNDLSVGAYGGGGGGASAFFTKPAWQVGTGVPSDGARDVPDLSLNASPSHDGLLFCVNVATGVSCGNGYRTSTTDDTLTREGGTSFDSQIFGGMLALVEQKIGARLGNANRTIYALANSTLYYTPGMTTATLPTVVFNDVTSGNNSMPCSTGSANCGNGNLAGYNAGNGYDLATGWGSVNLANLANAWNAVTPLSAGSLASNNSVTTVTVTPNTVAVASTATLTATVTGQAGAPTGTVQFFVNNVAVGPAVPVASGIATYPWVPGCSALGQQVISASYSGDATYQGSRGPALTAGGGNTSPVEVQVTSSTCPDFTIAAATPTLTVAAGGTIPPVTITVTPTNNFTGTVSFTAVVTSSTGYVPTMTFSPASVAIGPTASGTTSLTISGITAELRQPGFPGAAPAGTQGGGLPWYAAGSTAALAGLLLIVLPKRRRLSSLLVALVGVALALGASGCASSQSSPPTTIPPSTNPYIGTYTVTVTATYTSQPSGQVTQHGTVVTYTIN
jgi:hypothetical protein